jgi:hypothetical protein
MYILMIFVAGSHMQGKVFYMFSDEVDRYLSGDNVFAFSKLKKGAFVLSYL